MKSRWIMTTLIGLLCISVIPVPACNGQASLSQINLLSSNLKISWGASAPLKLASGGKDLIDLQPLPVKIENVTTALFSAIAYFNTSVCLWTELATDQAFEYATPITSPKYRWFWLVTGPHPEMPEWNFPEGAVSFDKKFYGWFNSYELGPLSEEAFGFDGNIDLMQAEIKSLIPPAVELNGSLIKFSTQLVGNITEIKVFKTQISPYLVGDYVIPQTNSDFIEEDHEDAQLDQVMGFSLPSKIDVDVNALIREDNLGIFPIRRNYISPQQVQGIQRCPAIGTDTVLTEGLSLRLRPNITYIEEFMQVRYRKIVIDTKTDLLTPETGIIERLSTPGVIVTDLDPRILAWQVQNWGMNIDLQVQAILFSTVPIEEGSEGYTALDLPLAQANTVYWENILAAERFDPNVQVDKSLDQWMILLVIGLIAVGSLWLLSRLGSRKSSKTIERYYYGSKSDPRRILSNPASHSYSSTAQTPLAKSMNTMVNAMMNGIQKITTRLETLEARIQTSALPSESSPPLSMQQMANQKKDDPRMDEEEKQNLAIVLGKLENHIHQSDQDLNNLNYFS